jgi:hypothetical protein
MSIPQTIHECIRSSGGIILTGENRRTRRKTWTDLGVNSGLRGKWPANNRLSYDTYQKCDDTTHYGWTENNLGQGFSTWDLVQPLSSTRGPQDYKWGQVNISELIILLLVPWILTAEDQVRARVNPMGFVVDKVALGQVFLRVLRFFPVNNISPLLMHHLGDGQWAR